MARLLRVAFGAVLADTRGMSNNVIQPSSIHRGPRYVEISEDIDVKGCKVFTVAYHIEGQESRIVSVSSLNLAITSVMEFFSPIWPK